jgi:hypothetical protein
MFLEREWKEINVPLQTERHGRLGKAPDSYSIEPVLKPLAGNLLYSKNIRGYPQYS